MSIVDFTTEHSWRRGGSAAYGSYAIEKRLLAHAEYEMKYVPERNYELLMDIYRRVAHLPTSEGSPYVNTDISNGGLASNA